MIEELKPCPFCGGRANIMPETSDPCNTKYRAICRDCKISTRKDYSAECEKQWNTRTQSEKPISEDVREASGKVNK